VLLTLLFACGGIDPTSGTYDVTLRTLNADPACTAPWNVAPPETDTQDWSVDVLLSTMTVDGVLFGDLEEERFTCESLLLADTALGSVAATIALTGVFTSDTSFRGTVATEWTCEGDACPTDPCSILQAADGTLPEDPG
jgi:hypothetical protein